MCTPLLILYHLYLIYHPYIICLALHIWTSQTHHKRKVNWFIDTKANVSRYLRFIGSHKRFIQSLLPWMMLIHTSWIIHKDNSSEKAVRGYQPYSHVHVQCRLKKHSQLCVYLWVQHCVMRTILWYVHNYTCTCMYVSALCNAIHAPTYKCMLKTEGNDLAKEVYTCIFSFYMYIYMYLSVIKVKHILILRI